MTTTMIMSEIKRLRSEIFEREEKIIELENQLFALAEQSTETQAIADPQQIQLQQTQTVEEPQQQTTIQQKTQTQQTDIIINQDYMKYIIKEAEKLEDNIACGSKLSNELKSIKINADYDEYDDIEDIIINLHQVIKKYAYDLDTRLSTWEWREVLAFIEKCGFHKVDVKIGDSIIPYRSYFERPIRSTDNRGIPNTIKSIQKIPMEAHFYDGFEQINIKLGGKCVYYK